MGTACIFTTRSGVRLMLVSPSSSGKDIDSSFNSISWPNYFLLLFVSIWDLVILHF